MHARYKGTLLHACIRPAHKACMQGTEVHSCMHAAGVWVVCWFSRVVIYYSMGDTRAPAASGGAVYDPGAGCPVGSQKITAQQ